jgi:hypothetical protein
MPRTLRRSALLLLALLLPLAGLPQAAAEGERDLEPVPRVVLFSDPSDGGHDLETQRVIEAEIQRSFASLGTVVAAREVLVRRFGVLSVPALLAALQRSNQTEGWNAALTTAGLRDTEGPALELKALLRPLVRTLSTSANPHDRAFAAIALGCFHWPDAELPPLTDERAGWYAAVPGPQVLAERGSRAMAEARKELVRLSNGETAFVRASALLALAKIGGPEVRAAHAERPLDPFTNPTPHRADLLTRAFLVMGEAKPYLQALRHEETPRRAAAALAVAVALLQENRAAWTTDSDEILKTLKSVAIKPQLSDGAEAVFARGICALQNQSNDEWKLLWKIARLATTERAAAEAAAQVLRFCDMPWFREAVVTWAAQPPADLKPSVLAMVLLRAGEQGSPEAIDGLLAWLRSRSKRPIPTTRWDPRWYAAVGLMRALHEGRIRPKQERARVIEGLRKSASQIMDKKAPFREALARVLATHGNRLAAAGEKALYRLPLADLRRLEAAFTCPHGLMTRDAIDACVLRVNAVVQEIFGLDGIIPWKSGETKQMPERFLKRYLDLYPYFSRLEFRERRGARPYPRLPPGAQGIDR